VILDDPMLITKQTTINEIISAYPETVKLFSKLQMSCSGCFAVKFDTLENGALMHGMEVNTLIEQLNQFISSLPTSVATSNPS
jgi:hybrid cluster-associated redox disulfide protein